MEENVALGVVEERVAVAEQHLHHGIAGRRKGGVHLLRLAVLVPEGADNERDTELPLSAKTIAVPLKLTLTFISSPGMVLAPLPVFSRD